MAEQQLKSLLPDWLAEVETCAAGRPPRPQPVVKGAWLFVDSGVAEAMLVRNTWNRQIRQKRVNEYADLMRRGLWDEGTPQMIVFDTDLRMADGQHRCHAIVQSGVGFWCLVVWGVAPQARLNIDRIGLRNSADNAIMAGFGDLIPGNGKRVLELANAFVQGMTPSKTSLGPADFTAVLEEYQDVFTRVTELFASYPRSSFFARATVRAVIARALYHGMSDDVAKAFVDILITGYSQARPGDRSAITLRNDYVTHANDRKRGGVNSNDNANIYAKCARALLCYAKGEDRTIIRPVTEDPWPINYAAAGAAGITDRVAGDFGRQGARGLPIDFLVTPRTVS